jgi:hypothetical protein
MALLDLNDPNSSNGSTQNTSLSRSQDPRGLADYIRERAEIYGIDPDVALRVAQSEGLKTFNSSIPGEKSYGAFQLHIGGGLGDEFRRDTGLDPADPANERATIDYALNRASQVGWGPWHGAKNTGIGQWQGIGQNAPANAVNPTIPPYQASAPNAPSAMAANVPPVSMGGQAGQMGRDRVGGGWSGGAASGGTSSAPPFLQMPAMQAPYFPPRPPPSQQLPQGPQALPAPGDFWRQRMAQLLAQRTGGYPAMAQPTAGRG